MGLGNDFTIPLISGLLKYMSVDLLARLRRGGPLCSLFQQTYGGGVLEEQGLVCLTQREIILSGRVFLDCIKSI